MKRRRAGVILLETMIALFLVGSVATSVLALLRHARLTEQRRVEQLRRLREADRLLSSVALWSSAELGRHLGSRPEGSWLLEIQQPVTGLYDVRVTDRASTRVWLRTRLFREPTA